MLISQENVNLIVTRKTVHEGKNLTLGTVINDLIDKGSRIIILRTGTIDVMVINTDPNGTMFLIYRNNVGDPFCQGNWVDETSVEKFLNLTFNGGSFLRGHRTNALMNRL